MTPKEFLKQNEKHVRRLRFESLENRMLLSVSSGDFDAIRSAYPELGISANMGDYNIIEVANLSNDTALASALTQAGQTEKNDLVVIHTTPSNHRISLNATELTVAISPQSFGSVTIVALGEKPLTLDAANQSRIFTVTQNSQLALGGLILTNGFSEDEGGAIRQESGTLTLDRCVLSENSAKTGGAIAQDAGSLTIYNSSIIENRSTSMGGGGILQNGHSFLAVNSTFANNVSQTYGGAIFAFPEVGDSTTLVNCTITENQALIYGGGLTVFDANAVVSNSIIYGNTADAATQTGDLFTLDATISVKCSMLGLHNGVNITTGVDGNFSGVDPKLRAAKTASNGQLCFPLENDSPAINSGNNNLIPSGINYDQIGSPRIVQDTVDIGAFERNPPIAKIDNATFLSVQEGCVTKISGASSDDSLGEGLTYFWDISGRGVFTQGTQTQWFSAANLNGKPGAAQKIMLKVVDTEGTESGATEASISITDVSPTYYIIRNANDTVVAGEPSLWTFSADDTRFDPIIRWSVDWGDSSDLTVFNGGPRMRIDARHVYREPGNYTITLKTTDFDGIESTASFHVSVSATVQTTYSVTVAEAPAAEFVTAFEPELSREFEDVGVTTDSKVSENDVITNSGISKIAQQQTTPRWDELYDTISKVLLIDSVFRREELLDDELIFIESSEFHRQKVFEHIEDWFA